MSNYGPIALAAPEDSVETASSSSYQRIRHDILSGRVEAN